MSDCETVRPKRVTTQLFHSLLLLVIGEKSLARISVIDVSLFGVYSSNGREEWNDGCFCNFFSHLFLAVPTA